METAKIRYHQPVLDEYVAKQFEEIKRLIIANAESYAVRNQPPPQSKKAHALFEEDHLKFQGTIDEVNRQLQFQTSCHHVTEHKQLTENKLRDAHNRQSAAKEQGQAIDAQLKGRKAPYGKHRMLFVWLATAIISLFDGLLSVPVFGAWGYSMSISFIMGLLFAFLLAVIAHTFQKIVSFGKTLWQQRIIAFLLMLLLIFLFYTMAAHRAEYLEKQVSEDTLQVIHFSPWPFALISLLLFIVSVTVNFFYHPTGEQRAAMREYEKLTKQKRDNDAEQERLKAEEAATEQEHVEVRQMNASILEYGNSLEELVISKAQEGYALFKKTNTMFRKDNCRPVSFDEPGYPFQFKTNFHTIKKLQ